MDKMTNTQYANQLIHEDSILVGKQRYLIEEAKDIRDFILPKTGQFESDPPDGRSDRFDNILDNTATKALRVLAAGMHSGLTSPSRPWFKLSTRVKALMDIRAIKNYIHEVQEVIYDILAKSNFYSAVQEVYEEEAGYGTACMLIHEDDEDIVRFYPLTFGSYRLSQSYRRNVNGVWRTLYMTSQQMADKFGVDNLPTRIKEDLGAGKGLYNPFQFYKVLHVIRNRQFYNPQLKTERDMPIESVYVFVDTTNVHGNRILARRGFKEWPAATPRWKISGTSAYGSGIGCEILGYAKQLQEMTEDKLLALAKIVDPPMKAPSTLKRKTDLSPGGVTFGDGVDKFEPLYQINGGITIFTSAVDDCRLEILKGSYNDLFLMLADQRPGVTATEIIERHDEKLLQLGPVIENQFSELCNPVISRVAAVAERANLLPPPPDELIEFQRARQEPVQMKVQYISLLAQAQKQSTIAAIKATTDYAQVLSQIQPNAIDVINEDEAIGEFADAAGAPPKMIRTKKDIEKIRLARAQAQAQMQQQQQQLAQAEAINKLGGAISKGQSVGVAPPQEQKDQVV